MKVLPPGKEGIRGTSERLFFSLSRFPAVADKDWSDGRPDVRQAECMVRNDWYSSVTWYEWEERVREHVDKLMAGR